VVGDGTVYFGSNDSTLYALDAASGQTRWTYQTRGPIRSTVAIEGDRLFLVGGDGVVYFGSGDGHVYALKSSTGEIVWKFKTGDVVHATPVLYGDKLFVGSFDGYVYALRRATGELAWKFKSVGHRFFPAGEMQGNPVAGNGLAYVGGRDYNIYALDTAKGFCHWNRQLPKGWALALTVSDTVLYVGSSDDDLVLALDGRTGAEIWKTDVHFNVFGAPAVTDSTLYVGTLQGKLLGLDRATGGIRWSRATDDYTEHHAEYFKSEDKVVKEEFYAIVGTPEGYIEALHKLGAIFSTPVIAGDRIYVSSTDGTVYCLGR
jgi:outer membrane protein assembly factor BamB